MAIKKRILRSKFLRPVLNRVYKDSDDHEGEKVLKCTDSEIFIKHYRDKKNRRKEDASKYYFS